MIAWIRRAFHRGRVIVWMRRALQRRRYRAIGYINVHTSGPRLDWDDQQLRSVAKRLGYTLMKTMTSTGSLDPVGLLITMVQATGADAVLVPDLSHLDGADLGWLALVADVIPIDDPDQALTRGVAGGVSIENERR